MLKFSPGKDNAKIRKLEEKIGKRAYTFSLLSGHNCPFANECKSMAVEQADGTRKIKDGPNTLFRCFSASQEVLWTGVYESRKKNFEAVKAAILAGEAGKFITSAIPKNAEIVRIHVGGDFFSQAYFDAWLEVCLSRPSVEFYAYTKSLPYWINRLGDIPANLNLTASYGGRKDDMIPLHNLKSAIVVGSNYQARKLGLPVDHDDSHALRGNRSFALIVHGVQPAGSKMAKAWERIRNG